jgi:hypothetical protein
MKIHTFRIFYELRNKFRNAGTNTQINNPSGKRPDSDISLTPDGQEKEVCPIDESTRRALELSRKGIFACPRYASFFKDEDERRIC